MFTFKPSSVNKLIVSDVSPNVSPSNENIKLYLNAMKTLDFNSAKTITEARKTADKVLNSIPSLKTVL